jgi:hypothetical protein
MAQERPPSILTIYIYIYIYILVENILFESLFVKTCDLKV